MDMQFNNRRSPQQRGFTALELIIVLIVGFSIIALSASKMGDLFSKSSEASVVVTVTDLATELRQLRSSSGYGPDGVDLTGTVNANKYYGPTMPVDQATGNMLSEWGGNITVTTADNGETVRIDYPGVPKKSCVKLSKEALKAGIFNKIRVNNNLPDLVYGSDALSILNACNVAAGAPPAGGAAGAAPANVSLSFYVKDGMR